METKSYRINEDVFEGLWDNDWYENVYNIPEEKEDPNNPRWPVNILIREHILALNITLPEKMILAAIDMARMNGYQTIELPTDVQDILFLTKSRIKTAIKKLKSRNLISQISPIRKIKRRTKRQ